MDEVIFRELYPQRHNREKKQLTDFLASYGLRYEDDIEFSCAIVDENEQTLACGCAAGNILKCFAIDPRFRGENLLGSILTRLLRERFECGITHLFVYTKPENTEMFLAGGFYLLAETVDVAMLENRHDGVEEYIRSLATGSVQGAGAIVMNCNPFTLGHRALIEYAAARTKLLHLFIVEEDRSLFPFEARLTMVQQGVAHLSNVQVHPSGPYMISGLTFPTYFLKEETDASLTQAELDLTLFAKCIAPPLGITMRFVGEEPVCLTTRAYNETMHKVLPAAGIAVWEIPRKATHSGDAISASTVRTMLRTHPPCAWLDEYVPPTTREWLCSTDAKPVLDKLSHGL